jgi:hypothetical protein
MDVAAAAAQPPNCLLLGKQAFLRCQLHHVGASIPSQNATCVPLLLLFFGPAASPICTRFPQFLLSGASTPRRIVAAGRLPRQLPGSCPDLLGSVEAPTAAQPC